jgi:putative redox protein
MTASVTIERSSGKRLLGIARGHSVVADRPLEDGGTDTGCTAGEFLLAALGFCTMGTLLAYGSRTGLPMEGLRIRLEGEKARTPDRYGRIKIVVTMDEQVGAETREKLHRMAQACTIHNTLVHAVEIDVEIA